MSGYALARRALSQLRDIDRHSRAHWGDAQAERYVRRLFETFERIAEGSIVSRTLAPEFGVQGNVCTCQRHFIYWRMQRSGRIEIVSVVDQRRLQSPQVQRAFGSSS